MLKVMGALPLVPLAGRVQRAFGQSERPNIILFVADALAARHLSLYGYPLDTSPHMQRLVDEGAVVYHNHYAAGNYTPPGTASLLTGTYPWDHRVFHLLSTISPSVLDLNVFRQLSLAGYSTLAFTQNLNAAAVFRPMIDHIATAFHYDAWSLVRSPVTQLMNRWPDRYQVKSLAADSMTGWTNGSLFTSLLTDLFAVWRTQQVTRTLGDQYPLGIPRYTELNGLFEVQAVMDGITDAIFALPEPYFAYVHIYPPHEPYRPTKPFLDQVGDEKLPVVNSPIMAFDEGFSDAAIEEQRIHYDAFVAQVDAEVGRLYARLKREGKLDNTILIFTSDHGEIFSNGQFGHTTELLYDDLVRIPLVIFDPAETTRRDVYDVTSCVDLVPSLVNRAGGRVDGRYPGQILPQWGGEATGQQAFAMQAATVDRHADRLVPGTFMVRDGRFKMNQYIGYNRLPDTIELFDMESDPRELVDIAADYPDIINDLVSVLNAVQHNRL